MWWLWKAYESHKPLSDSLWLKDKRTVLLEESTPTRIEMFHPMIKVITQNYLYWLTVTPALKGQEDTNHGSRLPPTSSHTTGSLHCRGQRFKVFFSHPHGIEALFDYICFSRTSTVKEYLTCPCANSSVEIGLTLQSLVWLMLWVFFCPFLNDLTLDTVLFGQTDFRS